MLHQTQTVEPEAAPTTEATLAVDLRATLDLNLDCLEKIRAGMVELEAQEAEVLGTLQAVLETIGTDKIVFRGVPVQIIRGTSSKLDWKKLYALGVTEAMKQQATTTKPKKAYVLVGKEKTRGDE